MSLPPPSTPPLGASPGPAAGWHPDPWRPGGLRWWDGSAWSSYTDADYPAADQPGAGYPGYGGYGAYGTGGEARDRVQALAGMTRWLSGLIAWAALLQAVAVFLTWTTISDIFEAIRDDDLDALQGRQADVTGMLGQLFSLAGLGLLVLRMVWLFRATAAAEAAGERPRRSAGLACCAWLIPIVNFWWPYQAIRDVTPDDAATRRTAGWWWATYLFGAFGVLLATIALFVASSGVAYGVLGVTGASLVVSALLERRLVLSADRWLRSRVGLNLDPGVTTEA